MPSCFFFSTEKREILLDDKGRDPAIAGFGICVGEETKISASLPLVIQACGIHDKMIAFINARVCIANASDRNQLR